jgi:hypothetical protein
MNRRALIIVLAILGAIAAATALLAIIGGPTAEPGGGPTTPSIDSEYRFAHVIWLGAGVVLLWTLRRPEERALVTRVVLVIAAVGGLARLVSIAVVGLPHPVFVSAMVLELVIVPLVVLWHSRVVPLKRAVR